MSGVLHVVPVGDLVEHATDDGCVCGPTAKPIKDDDGSIGWIMVHHALDSRELTGHDHEPP